MRFCFERKNFVDQQINPDKIAIIGEERSLTWSQFQYEVEELGQQLIRFKNIKQPVVIYGHKEVEFIVAIFTCIKFNITYIPIDIIYPKDRLERVIEIADVALIINCSKQALEVNSILKANYKSGLIEFENEHYSELAVNDSVDQLIYIIFTSGSTGEPKGVQISTQAVQSFVHWMRNDFSFTHDDVFINTAIFSFDLSVYELFSFAAIGASLLLNSKTVIAHPELFLKRIGQNNGTIWVSTPSFSYIFSRIKSPEIEQNVRFFLFCGEVLPNTLARSLKNHYPDTIIYNTYGPTEATVATSLITISEQIIEKYNPLPVGFPKKDAQILIEDNEIIIIGPHVSLGYLNRPDLNEQKFFSKANQRAFRTGDLGYFQDGMLFCSGRNDDQIKMHGYRIELNEISAKLEEFKSVIKAETIPLIRNNEVKKIVSLIKIDEQLAKPEIQAIYDFLKRKLPIYMVPSDIKIIDYIPLNQNGKADKSKLREIYLDKNQNQ